MKDSEFIDYLLTENEQLEKEVESLKAGQNKQTEQADPLKQEVDEILRKQREDASKAKEDRLKRVKEAQSKQPSGIHPIYRSF
jgi:hypothetical protein